MVNLMKQGEACAVFSILPGSLSPKKTGVSPKKESPAFMICIKKSC
ncbi:hypothetical protein B4090_2760 [Bacillus licheniformis]|nr:hypothetical protein B4090_2760 [Bacillus licheniformis]TWJ97853.1 hypothetical protein CHCC20487_1089 [Bacillus licheniformis]